MNTAVYIRLKYNDGPEFEWRLSFFHVMCLRSLLAQKDQNFDIVVLCNPEHKDCIESLSSKIKTIHKEIPISGDPDYKRKGEKNSVMPFGYKVDYDTCIRLDSDDMVSRDFIGAIRKRVKGADKITLLAFKPIKFELSSLRLYYNYMNYSKSMCLALYNPDRDVFIYDRGHRQYDKLVKRRGGEVHVMKFWYYFQTIHGNNASSDIKPTDKLVE